jgi:RHS repeat-associated protein
VSREAACILRRSRWRRRCIWSGFREIEATSRHLTLCDPLGNVTTNNYDAVGNLDWTKDANNHQTNYTYDAAGRILTITAPDGGLTTYTYDGNGNLKTRKDDNNHTTTYTYDDAGRLTQATGQDPDGAGPGTPPVTTYTYDVNGNRLTMIDPNGNATQTAGDGKTTYTYDRNNRLKTIAYSDTTPGVTYNYDPVGNRSSMVDGSGTLTYTYDNLDRLLSATRGTTTFSYTYDPTGNVLTRTYPDNTQITYAYDEDNRLASVASGGNITTYSYDPASNLTQTALPSGNGYTETRSYDRAGRLTEVKNATASSTLSDYVSTLDPVGNPTTIQDGSNTTSYTYDPNDRLTGVCYQTSCPGAADPFIRWTYDKVGNRLTEQRPSGTTNYTYNGLDQLSQAGTTSYTYDQNGNEKTAGTRTFTYDLTNRLKTTTSGSTTTTYTYDGDGNRLQASTGNQASKKTNYLWDTNRDLPQLALERDGNNALLRRYTYGIRRIAMRSSSVDYYYHYDSIGSVRNVTSASGVKQWTDVYEPFGAIRSETKDVTGAADNFMKFTGEYLDPTGIYHLRARQYDPGSGRFLQVDPMTASQARSYASSYIYVEDRPTLLLDPSGLCATAAQPTNDGELAADNASSPNIGYGCGNTGAYHSERWPLRTRETYAFQYFSGRGLADFQSAGILGNLLVESAYTLDPRTPGGGIAQWGGPRWVDLINFARSNRASEYCYEIQVWFIWYELRTKPYLGYANLKATRTLRDATDTFMSEFEKPAIPHEDRRFDSAKKILNLHGSGAF